MADFNQQIANSLKLYGIAPTNKWGAHAWNAFLWGEGTADLEVRVTKPLGDTLTLDTATSREASRVIAETLALSGDLYSQSLRDLAGYSYVFADRTTDGEQRALPNWGEVSTSSASWATAVPAAIVWS